MALKTVEFEFSVPGPGKPGIMENIKYIFISITCLLFFINNPIIVADDHIKIISYDNGSLNFTVKISPENLQQKMEKDLTVSISEEVTIGIPPNGTVQIESVAGTGNVTYDDSGLLRGKRLRKNPLVKLGEPILVRGRELIPVQIFPVHGGYMFEEITIGLTFSQQILKSSTVKNSDPQFDKILKATVVNADQVIGWGVDADRSSFALSTQNSSVFDLESNWYKLFVSQTGIHRVYGDDLEQAGLELTNLSSSNLRIYYGGGLQINVQNSDPRTSFDEIPILVEDGGDNQFDPDDYIIFYGEATDRWIFNPDTFVTNTYTKENVYFLTTNNNVGQGLRITSINGSPAGTPDTIINTFNRMVHVEQDNLLRKLNTNEIYDYYRWYWSDEDRLNLFVATPARIFGDTALITLFGKTFGVGNSGRMDLNVNGITTVGKQCNSNQCEYKAVNLLDGLNEMDILLQEYSNAPPFFDFLNIKYTSQLIPENDMLDIPIGFIGGLAEVRVFDNFSTAPLLFDISNPRYPNLISNYSQTGGFITFQVNLSAENHSRYFVASNNKYFKPSRIESVFVKNLRASHAPMDLIAITPDEFEETISEYVDFRTSQGHKILVTNVKDIMDNFSFGLYDPTAIRDYLKYEYESNIMTPPTHALFIGDGTYDFHDILNTGVPNLIPPFVNPFDVEQFYSDDNYLYFGNYGIIDSDTSYDTSSVSPDRGFDMVSARWPVRNIDELSVVIEKIKSYEQKENLGDWRTNITIVADDEFTSRSSLESLHTKQAEELEKEHIPAEFMRDKIYLWEYPFVNRKKPAVNDAIVNDINDGTLIINYVGHGNPDLWAHEHVFTRTDDLPRLNNIDKLPLVFTASCEIAFFDDPKREGMAEDLLVMPNGGGIGVISATRRVYSGPNAAFNRKVFDVMLYDKSLTISEAMYTAKLLRQYKTNPPSREDNDQAYLFFGDPLMKLGIPKYDIEFDESASSIKALEPVHISGRIIDENNLTVVKDGEITVNVFDSDRNKTHFVLGASNKPRDTIEYSVNGPAIFRGTASVTNGMFEFDFVPPLDIGYGGEGARISVYAILDDIDGFGLIDSISVASEIALSTDTAGPIIDFEIIGRTDFVSGDYIGKSDKIIITLSDSSGLNLTGGLGHGITLELDNNPQNTLNLTELFEYTRDDFRSGSLEYEITDLDPGLHTFKIKAWDNANNSSSVEFEGTVVISESFEIVDLLNYPNPMQDSTIFSFTITQPISQLSVEIFTLSGKKIKSFNDFSRRNPGYYDDIVWYGKDFDRYRVATGVYIYKATAVGENDGTVTESFGKIVIIN